ncbi:MAG: hypothetical protein WC343_11455 [Bacilli bacterium]|jgi:hypothetical protein
MDKFFKNVTAEELVKDFEELGYKFEKVDRKGGCVACQMVKSGVKSRKALPHTCDGYSVRNTLKK